jgi:HK97 family phage major capsid protein
MSIKELQDQRNKLMQDAQKLLKNPTAETRTMFDAQMADVDLLEKDIERAERSAKYDAEMRSAGRPPRSQPGFTATDTNEQAAGEHRALEQYIRFGNVSEENLRSFAPLVLSSATWVRVRLPETHGWFAAYRAVVLPAVDAGSEVMGCVDYHPERQED